MKSAKLSRALCTAMIAAGCGNASSPKEGAPTEITGKTVQAATDADTVPASLRYTNPDYLGTMYQDSVPDTLDLASMAGLSINGMTRVTDPTREYSLYFLTDFQVKPVVLRLEGDDPENDPTQYNASIGKFIAPLQWNRIISGDKTNLNLQYGIVDRYLRHLNWTMNFSGPSARAFEGFIVNYFRDKNPMWKLIVLQSLQDWVERIHTYTGDNGEEYGSWDDELLTGGEMIAADPWRDELLLLAYKKLGYARALTALGRHITYARKYSGFFAPDGTFQDNHPSPGTGHFHIHALYLQAFLDYATLTRDTELLNWVVSVYQWAKSSDAHSVDLLGYFPELVWRTREHPQVNSEGCALSDMVTLAIKLARSGASAADQYWDDADRWLRNHWAEAQLTAAFGNQLKAWSDQYGNTDAPEHPEWEDSTLATERSRGGFAGWPAADNWRSPDERGIQQCCTGNGSRSIAFAWQNILDYTSGVLRLNLLLNRASAQVDVYSHIPYVGRVDVKAKQYVRDVRVRIPRWVTSAVTAKVNGASRGYNWDGRYVKVGALNGGDVLSVTFTISESTATENIAGRNFSFTKRGSTVVSMSPVGNIAPLYQRSRYRSSPAPMISVNRFVTNESDIFTKTDDTWELPVDHVAGSGDDDHRPDNLLDGDQSSWWMAANDGDAVTFDLGASYTIKYVSAAFPQGENVIDRFDVQVSTNGTTFTTARSGIQSCGIATGLQGFKLDRQLTGRYVKLVAHPNSAGGNGQYSQFDIWGTKTGAAALTSSSTPASASQSDAGTSPGKTLDGSTLTRWSASGVGEWVMYDLGMPRTVDQVELAMYQGTSRAQYFDIEVRATPDDDWTLIYRSRSSGTTSTLETYDVPNSVAWQVRIVGRGGSNGSLNGITEAKILGY